MFTEKIRMLITLKKGFTLIELLVVISIIALLTSVVMGQLNNAKAKARDRALVSGIHEIQTALELYRSKYGSYPGVGGVGVDATIGDYYSQIKDDGVWSGSSISLEQKLKEFLPKISAPQRVGGGDTYIRYYKMSNARCPNQTNIPPYIMLFRPETNSLDSLFPAGYLYGSTLNQTEEKCVSLK